MKVVVRLAIVVAALLLVTNMSFARIVCDQTICYDIVETAENGDTNSDFWVACLNNDGTGSLYSNSAQASYDLYLFGGGPGWFNTSGSPAFGGNSFWTTWILGGPTESAFLQPIGEGWMITAEGVRFGFRWTAKGTKVPCPSCNPGYTQCGNQCVDLLNDPLNCGTCGNVCLQGYFCSAGQCIGT
jgi:hypothetical protein